MKAIIKYQKPNTPPHFIKNQRAPHCCSDLQFPPYLIKKCLLHLQMLLLSFIPLHWSKRHALTQMVASVSLVTTRITSKILTPNWLDITAVRGQVSRFINFLPAFQFFFLILLLPVIASAQQFDTVSRFHAPILLDTFVVKSGFDVDAFIHRVQNDTTFYKSFKSMHLINYTATNDIRVLDKKGGVIASSLSNSRQIAGKGCRITKTLSEKVSGDFYKASGSYRYYTAELYDYLFFAKKQVCHQDDIVAGAMETRGMGKMEKNKYELKQLIFNPGSKISGVPLMGDRASIFDESERHKYIFRIWLDTCAGQDCYVFKIIPKDQYKHKVVFNELTTWFRKSDYAILARNYSISYSTMFYDFDVNMKVRTLVLSGKLYPNLIDYDGDWYIFTKKRERVKFRMTADYETGN